MKLVYISDTIEEVVTDDWGAVINRIRDNIGFPVIRRVKMTDQDFLNYCVMNQGMFDKVCISLEWDENLEPSYSGSYVVYKGVCIQTHESYKD